MRETFSLWRRSAWLFALTATVSIASAQAPATPPEPGSLAVVSSDPAAAALQSATSAGRRGQGGGTQADFDTLIDLIVTTVAPLTWEDVGGVGTIQEFPAGVYVDADGTLVRRTAGRGAVAARGAALSSERPATSAETPSSRRVVSLRRLDAALARRLALGLPATDAMRNLAGLRRLEFLVFDRRRDDVLLVGPAGGWAWAPDGRRVSTVDGHCVLQLDDLAMFLRRSAAGLAEPFGCSIEPTEDGLRRLQAYAAASQTRPLPAGGRRAWVRRLRTELGTQDVHVFGVDPRSRAAKTLVEADYDMKLIGMGLQRAAGVKSYLARAAEQPTPPPMEVLRWWFVLDYQLAADPAGEVIELAGRGIKLLSENEFLTQTGRRVPTGATSELNRAFAEDFTARYDDVAAERPVYSDLQNVFALAVAASQIAADAQWPGLQAGLVALTSPRAMPLAVGAAPRQVESVVGVRSVRRGLLVAGVSGGVTADPARLVARTAESALGGDRLAEITRAESDAASRWWWD